MANIETFVQGHVVLTVVQHDDRIGVLVSFPFQTVSSKIHLGSIKIICFALEFLSTNDFEINLRSVSIKIVLLYLHKENGKLELLVNPKERGIFIEQLGLGTF